MPNVLVYILDRENRLQPFGAVGELCIGGAGVGRGYINLPELTAERFCIPLNRSYKSYRSYISKRIYKTGDLARWLPDGNLEFIGRIDQQVKIRGYRIELEGIENRILLFPGVKETVVVTRQKKPAGSETRDRYICAYVVIHQDQSFEVLHLKKYLSRHLPDFMIPWKFVELDKLPLTPNGKVDKKALPLPAEGEGESYQAPVNRTQKKLVEIWSQLLGIHHEKIGIDADFFDLGGHSLKAVIMVSRVHKEFGVKIPLTEIFRTPMIRELSAYIAENEKESFSPIDPVEKREYYELSAAQKRLYILQQMDMKSTFYNKPYVMQLQGVLDMDRLEGVFKTLFQRHESFRTSFKVIDDEPVQRIYNKVEFEIEYYDLTTNEENYKSQNTMPLSIKKAGAKTNTYSKSLIPNKIETAAHHSSKNRIIHHSFIRPFDLTKMPLVRVGLIKREEEKHILMMDSHHITSDGMSMEVVVKELMMLLAGKELAPLRLQYKDFSQWQNSEKNREIINRQQTYWQGKLSGDIPVLNLHLDFPRPALQSFAGDRMSFGFSREQTHNLNTLAKEQGATLYILMLAVFYVLLSKLSGQEDIVIGTPVVGRRHADFEHVVGMFVNTLALRNYPIGTNTFKQFLDELKQRVLQAFDNQDYQFESLLDDLELKRDMSRNPLFDVVFALQKFDIPHLQIPGLELSPHEYENLTAKFDLNLMGSEQDEKLGFTLEYCTKLFKPETIARYIDNFKRITRIILEDPEKKLREIRLISAAEKQQILNDFNNTVVEYPRDKTIHELFREQAERTPDNIALMGPLEIKYRTYMTYISYGELNQKSDQLAGMLQEKGVESPAIVSITGDRSIDMIIGILGILKAGGAYLPIDPDYPQDRIDFMLKDSNTAVLLTASTIEKVPYKSYRSYMSYTSTGNSLAYIMYTSGSTGNPKGVLVNHRNVVRLVKNTNFVELSANTRILQTGAPVFDATTFEIWGSLLNGGVLHLAANEVILDGKKLGLTLQKNHINTLWLSSPLFNQLMRQNSAIFSTLEYLLVGGDVLSPVYINQVRRENKGLKVINGYGPTENTTFSACYCINRDYESGIPLGRPINNSTAYIVDKYNYLQPIGIPGELYVGGDGVSRGYLNNPELTAEKFDHDSWDCRDYHDRNHRSYKSYPSYILYRTGDLARWLKDGNIEFLGRIDTQVKIRGFRVEIDEIESHLLKNEKVKGALVTVIEKEQDKSLCAYIAGASDFDKELFTRKLRESLSRKLPGYMVPSYFVFLEKLPLNPNGKVNHRALPTPRLTASTGGASPRDELEVKLVRIWADVLGVPRETIGIHDDFFENGGHSLKAALLASRVSKTFNVEFALTNVFTGPTISELAVTIRKAQKRIYEEIIPVEKKKYYPQSSAQKRIFFLEQFENIGYSCHIVSVLKVEGKLNQEQFNRAIKQLTDQHEPLRTSFELIHHEPVQIVHDGADIEIHWPPKDTTAKIGEEKLIKSFIKPFDLTRPPLMRVSIAPLRKDEYLLMYDIHHIIGDGTSLGILMTDFIRSYNGETLNPLNIQYKDFALWQNNLLNAGRIKKQEEYWLNQFSGDIPQLDFPTDFPRPTRPTFEGTTFQFQLEKEIALKFKAISAEIGATLFMNLLAVYHVLLYQYTGNADIIVGTAIMGRDHASLHHIIGMFINMLAMRNFSSREETYLEFLEKVKENTLKTFENQEMQFEDLVEKLKLDRDPGRNPLFDVELSLNNFEEANIDGQNLGDINFMPYQYRSKTSKFDLALIATEVEDKIIFIFKYSTSLFKEETIKEIARHFIEVVDQVTKDPNIIIGEITLTHHLALLTSHMVEEDQTDFEL